MSGEPVVYLETERLVLRRFTPDDLGDLIALDADPEVMRYISGGAEMPPDEQPEALLPYWLAYYDRGDRYGFWAAIERSTETFIGWFHLRPNPEDPDDEPELGYRLVRSAWGRGTGWKSALGPGSTRVTATQTGWGSASGSGRESASARAPRRWSLRSPCRASSRRFPRTPRWARGYR